VYYYDQVYPMIILRSLIIIIIAIGFLYWLLQYLMTLRVVSSVPSMQDIPVAQRSKWPRVSVVIPARNEQSTIEKPLRRRLETDYPNLEIIVIDDRSTDKTGKIADRIAAGDKRVKVLHLKEIPENWIGKLYALQKGTELATGEWMLFSDADVYIEPGTLKKSVTYCEENGFKHLAVIPDLLPVNFIIDVVLSVFIRHICIFGRVWKTKDPRSDAAVGSGAFNFVHRSALEKIDRFNRIKSTVVDDIILGRVLKQAGVRAGVLNGRKSVSVYFYRSLRDMAVGSERALFTMFGRYTLWRLVVFGLFMFFMESSPFIALILWGIPYIQACGFIMVLLMLIVTLTMTSYLGCAWWTSFFGPLGSFIMLICMARAGILGKKRGGIIWRGTFYSIKQLKKSQQ
jgi:cellulose synthase/poly-beta-1,6-N-acetylglucosamine synthase-like glycosyltransferase